MSIYLFRNDKVLHDGGHAATALAVSSALKFLVGLPGWLAFFLGCTALGIILESIDTFFGGLLVSSEQRKRILENAKKRGYKPSADSVKDFANYQIPWALFFIFSFGMWPIGQIVGVLIAAALFYVHYQFYTRKWWW